MPRPVLPAALRAALCSPRLLLPAALLTAAVALTVGACDNSSLVGDGAFVRPNVPNAPTAVATATPATGAVPFDVTFSAEGSSQPQGQALALRWTFWDGTYADGVTVRRQIAAAGRYRALLTVTDEAGRTDTASAVVTATAPSAYPCPVLDAPAAGTFFASTCDTRPTINAPAAYFVMPPSATGERTANVYLLDVNRAVQLRFYSVLAPGAALAPGTYALLPANQAVGYGTFVSRGIFFDRTSNPLTGTLTVDALQGDLLSGSIIATYPEGGGSHPMRVRFAARLSDRAL